MAFIACIPHHKQYGNRPISIFQNSAVNNRPQHDAPGNRMQCLWS